MTLLLLTLAGWMVLYFSVNRHLDFDAEWDSPRARRTLFANLHI